tara:strand:- start:3462 stop:4193 length:732 start_codon:yes stop_codon:yes gene_type:complete
MKQGCVFITHQGWTDIIVCLSIPFYLSNLYNEVIIIVREDARKFCDFLYSNNPKIKLEYFTKKEIDHKKINCIGNYIKRRKYKFMGTGEFWRKFDTKLYLPGSIEYFYAPINVNPEEHYNSFFLTRDKNLEEKRYLDFRKKYRGKYIIVNEDNERKLNIDRKKINSEYQIFNINNSSDILFDMIKILENSEEIHLISTFWSMLIKIIQKKYNLFEGKNIYFHDYVRKGYYKFLYSNTNWIFIN